MSQQHKMLEKRYDHFKHWLSLIQFTQDVEEKLCIMFREVEQAFERYCKKHNRIIGFLSYRYVIYKLLQHLGEADDDVCSLLLIKSTEKLSKQEEIFAFICKDLGWEFIPYTTVC